MPDFKKLLADKRAKEALEKQLKQVKKDSAPSMVPNFKKKRAKKEEEPPPPDITELALPKSDMDRLSELAKEMAEINRVVSMSNKRKRQLSTEAKELCNNYDLSKFKVGDIPVSYYSSVRSKILKELLLGAGVSPETIAKATSTKESWSIRVGSENGDEEGED